MKEIKQCPFCGCGDRRVGIRKMGNNGYRVCCSKCGSLGPHVSVKGKIVEVIAISQDTESPGHYQVVYKCEDGSIWSRPYGMFVSKVDKEKYPDAKQEYRFE